MMDLVIGDSFFNVMNLFSFHNHESICSFLMNVFDLYYPF